MRFMVLVKANEETEAGVMPTTEEFAEMGKFNEELVKAGVMLDGAGLQPSSKGVRIDYDGDKPAVIDGPFAETKELLAGYWIIQVKNLDEAVAWLKRAPFPKGTVEIRKLMDAEDFGEAYTPEIAEHEKALAAQIAAQKGA